MQATLMLLLILTICSSLPSILHTLNDMLMVFASNNTFKHTNVSDNTTANINCANFHTKVSCKSVCKPLQQTGPSQASPNDTSAYNTLKQLQKR